MWNMLRHQGWLFNFLACADTVGFFFHVCLAIHTAFLVSSASLGLLTQSQRKLGKWTHGCVLSHSLQTPTAPCHWLSMLICGCRCANSNDTILFLHSPLGFSTSQLFTAFGNCLFYQAPNLPIFNFCFLFYYFLFCFFLSCLSSVPEEFVLLSWAKGIQHHLPLLDKWEVLHWSLQITSLHSSSVLSLPQQQGIILWSGICMRKQMLSSFVLEVCSGEGEGSSAVFSHTSHLCTKNV